MFRRAFSRKPDDAELERWTKIARDFAARQQDTSSHSPIQGDLMKSLDVWKNIAHTMFNAKEFIYVRNHSAALPSAAVAAAGFKRFRDCWPFLPCCEEHSGRDDHEAIAKNVILCFMDGGPSHVDTSIPSPSEKSVRRKDWSWRESSSKSQSTPDRVWLGSPWSSIVRRERTLGQ